MSAAVVREAMSWIGTPYAHMQRLKGPDGGVDCAQILIGVFSQVGLVPELEIEWYPHDWHMHRSTERYLAHLLNWADEIDGPSAAGDVILMRFGRCFSHGAIYVGDGRIVHSYVGRGVELAELDEFAERPKRFFRVRNGRLS